MSLADLCTLKTYPDLLKFCMQKNIDFKQYIPAIIEYGDFDVTELINLYPETIDIVKTLDLSDEYTEYFILNYIFLQTKFVM